MMSSWHGAAFGQVVSPTAVRVHGARVGADQQLAAQGRRGADDQQDCDDQPGRADLTAEEVHDGVRRVVEGRGGRDVAEYLRVRRFDTQRLEDIRVA